MYTILIVIQVVSAISIVALILLQQGKGADAGASFGGGGSASQTFFGSAGSGNFLTHSTAILVAVFFITSLALAYYAKRQAEGGMDIILPQESTELPMIDTANESMSDQGALPVANQTQGASESQVMDSVPLAGENLEMAPVASPETLKEGGESESAPLVDSVNEGSSN